MNMSKVLVIHHNDPDGRMGGFIMKKYFEGKEFTVKTMEADYSTEFNFSKLLESGDTCCIVDYSLNNHWMLDLQHVIDPKNIVWIDHHESAIQKFNKSPLADTPLDGIRFIGLSGCELAWIYSQGWREKTPGKMVNINRDAGDLDFTDIYDIEIPKAVALIGDFDCWRKQFKESDFLVLGIESVWNKCLLTIDWGVKFWDSMLHNKENIIDIFVARGKIIKEYVDSQNRDHVLKGAFACHIRKFADVKAVALNTDSIGSWVFDCVKDKFEVGLVFHYIYRNKSAKMSFSIYRLGLNKTKKIDVAKIAESFGGGGHADAAGFMTAGSIPFLEIPTRYPEK
jgi:oligoribonuclease NrnB/cAMP/cGMP phosphodiesterase (DHH superfamily)